MESKNAVDTFRAGDRVEGPNGLATVQKVKPAPENAVYGHELLTVCVLYDGWDCVQWGRPEQYRKVAEATADIDDLPWHHGQHTDCRSCSIIRAQQNGDMKQTEATLVERARAAARDLDRMCIAGAGEDAQLLDDLADEIERLHCLLNDVALTIVGGAGSRRVCDGPGSYGPESGPSYDEIFAAHRTLEAIVDAL